MLENIFDIDTSVNLNDKELKYLNEMSEEVEELLQENGEEGSVKIREVVLDALLKDGEDNIIKFLGLEFEEEIKETLSKQLDDDNFKRIENKEDDKDFFKSYLVDDTLNDLILNWKGYIRKAEGSKEVFIKVRKSIIPSRQIDALYNLLIDNFNKINFLSEKEDEEQAKLIILTLDSALDIIIEIPYECCDTPRTVEIMSAMGLKMTNLIGFSKGNRQAILSALSESYQSKDSKTNKEKTTTED